MRMIEQIISDCCGDDVQGYDFCRCCLEHCTPIVEYYPDPTDPEYNQNWTIPQQGVGGAEKFGRLIERKKGKQENFSLAIPKPMVDQGYDSTLQQETDDAKP